MANKKLPTKKSRAATAKRFSPRRFSRVAYAGLVLMFAAFGVVGYQLLAPSSAATLTTSDVTFCNGEQLDFYGPRTKKYAKTPLIIYVHGGALVAGDKTYDTTQINFLAQLQDRGYALAAINYHLLTEAPNTTAPIDDTLCAIRWARANATALGIDPDRIGMFGWSAGAQLAALADTLPPGSTANKGAYLNYSSRPQATIALAGVYDFNWELANPIDQASNLRNQVLANIYQGMAPADLQPYNDITADDPPLLLIHGLNDAIVNPVHTDRMEAKAKLVGARYQVIRVTGAAHGLEPNDNSIRPTQTQVNASMAAFMDSNLRIASAALYVPPAAKPAPTPVAKPSVTTAPKATAPAPAPATSANTPANPATASSDKPNTDTQSSIDDISRDSAAVASATKAKRMAGWVFVLTGLLVVAGGGLLWLWLRRRSAKEAAYNEPLW